MSSLFDLLRLLHTLGDGVDNTWQKQIQDYFRETYTRNLQQDIREYVDRVLAAQPLAVRAIARLLGYRSSSAISSIKNGTISLKKFELLQGTFGADTPWVTSLERRSRTLADTVMWVRRELMKEHACMVLDQEALGCLEQALSEDGWLSARTNADDDVECLNALFARVASVVPTGRIYNVHQLKRLLNEWGPAYIKTKRALDWFVKDASRSRNYDERRSDS